MTRGLRCREVVELVTEYLDGALAPEVAARLDAHLEGCDACRSYLEQIRSTTRLTAAAGAAVLRRNPDRDALLTAFRGLRRG